MFILKTYVAFWKLGAFVAGVGSLLSWVVTYEENLLYKFHQMQMSMEENKLVEVLALIASTTIINGVRIYFASTLKHKLYVHSIDYFFNRLCLQKLEHWDVNFNKSEMVKCVHTDIMAFVDTCMKVLSILMRNVITTSIVIYLLYKNSVMYMMGGVMLCVLRSVLLERIAKSWEQKLDCLNESKRELEDVVAEYVNNVNHMQLCGLNRVYKGVIGEMIEDYKEKGVKESRVLAIFMTCFSGLTKFIDVGLYFVITVYDTSLGVFEIQVLISYIKLLTESAQGLSDIPKVIKQNKDSYKRIRKYFSKENSRSLTTPKAHMHEEHPCMLPVIKFKRVTFKYPMNERNVFDEFDKEIEYGSKYALTGRSGIGKTSLLKLLLGLYTPQNGHVVIDDRDVTTITDIGEYISVVPQEPIIFEYKTLRENMTIFKKASDEKLKEVLRNVELSEYSNELDERLVNLSGGQKQRLSIARAMLSDAPIVLLDEPFSAMDEQLKEGLKKAVWEYTRDKTVIMITHESIPDGFKELAISAGK